MSAADYDKATLPETRPRHSPAEPTVCGWEKWEIKELGWLYWKIKDCNLREVCCYRPGDRKEKGVLRIDVGK